LEGSKLQKQAKKPEGKSSANKLLNGDGTGLDSSIMLSNPLRGAASKAASRPRKSSADANDDAGGADVGINALMAARLKKHKEA